MKLGRVVAGRAGAGKSKLVLETIAAQRFERPQILLVPEHATHEAELDLCRALGDTASRDRGGAELPEPCHPRTVTNRRHIGYNVR